MDGIGYYIMMALLLAGAAYGLANRDKPKPTVSKGKKRILFICGGIVVGGALLLVAVALLAHPVQH